MIRGKAQGVFIARGKQRFLAACAAAPYGAHGVQYVLARQAIAARDLGLSGLAAAQSPAFFKKLRPRRAVDAAVHPAPTQKRAVGRVDNGVHAHGRNVAAHDLKRHGDPSFFHSIARFFPRGNAAAAYVKFVPGVDMRTPCVIKFLRWIA